MRRLLAIAAATSREIKSEPLALLLTAGAVLVALVAPVMHCHQFGDPARTAREAALSCMTAGGMLFAVFCTIRTVRREYESGTSDMALSHPVSRAGFQLAKTAGAAYAYVSFALTLAAVSLVTVNGATIGGKVAAADGDIARMWGPSAALVAGSAVVPIAAAAILNRFYSFRFALCAFRLTTLFAIVSVFYRFDAALFARYPTISPPPPAGCFSPFQYPPLATTAFPMLFRTAGGFRGAMWPHRPRRRPCRWRFSRFSARFSRGGAAIRGFDR